MKKQLFLLTLVATLLSGQFFAATDSNCNPCKTDCKTTSTDCKKCCLPEHGKTFLRVENSWQHATPSYASMFSTHSLRNLHEEDKHGAFQVSVFGGKNTKQRRAAQYFLPCGHDCLTFDGSVPAANVGNFVQVANYQNDGQATPAAVPATYQFDLNKDTSKILPWNFGITYAAFFNPEGNTGNGEIINPAFKSQICPCWNYSHIGAGLGLRYHFSDDKNGFFFTMSTAVEHVKSRVSVNETVSTVREEINVANTALTAGVKDAYLGLDVNGTRPGTGFPVDETGLAQNANTPAPPANVEAAFQQSAWKYGKMGCQQKITRLADIELGLGYQWFCSDCCSTNWYVGVVIPTGNKPCAEWVAPAVVGNGQHAGIMSGGTTEVMLSDEDNCAVWWRLDVNGRYLFRNTQKRSFDLCGNEWSRYMMVWENKAAYTTAVANLNDNAQPSRHYEPGINVFTHEMHVKPRFQGRINQALYFQGECLRGELGWNIFARQKECVEFACKWDKAPAFADSSFQGGIGLNNNRTIYNDSQTTSINQVPRLVSNPASASDGNAMGTQAAPADTDYDKFAISEADVNLDSAASPCVITHTPYGSLGYAWDSDCMPNISVGASYEFNACNAALNQWLVWGKFELSF